MSADKPKLSVAIGPGEHHPTWNPASLNNVPAYIEARAGSAAWIRFAGTAYTSDRIVESAAGWAARLAADGMGFGLRIGLLMRNRPEFTIAWLAINRLGACAVFIPSTMPPALLVQYFAIAEIDALIVQEDLLVGLNEAIERPIELGGDVRWARMPRGRRSDPAPVGAADPACILFTSGSSGLPKAVLFSHRYVLELGHMVAHGKGFAPGERMFFCSPMFHGDGVLATLISLIVGGELHLMPRFSTSSFWDDTARDGSTMFYFVGAILSFLLQSERGPVGSTTLRFATGGGAPEFVARRFEERFGIQVLEAYSQTECLACCSNRRSDRKIGTVGRPYPGVEVQIVDPLDQPVPIGAVGEIVVRPPRPHMTFAGYFGNPEATAEKLRNLLLHTGDLGSIDADGFLQFRGRMGFALRRRGENILPEQVEFLVEQLPWVRRAAAIGVASEHGDQDILLLLLPHDTHPTVHQIVEDCLSILPRAMQPRWVELVDSLPMTPTNKLSRRELQQAPGQGANLVR